MRRRYRREAGEKWTERDFSLGDLPWINNSSVERGMESRKTRDLHWNGNVTTVPWFDLWVL